MRPKIGIQSTFQIADDLSVTPIAVQDLLDLRDRLVNRSHPQDGDSLAFWKTSSSG